MIDSGHLKNASQEQEHISEETNQGTKMKIFGGIIVGVVIGQDLSLTSLINQLNGRATFRPFDKKSVKIKIIRPDMQKYQFLILRSNTRTLDRI